MNTPGQILREAREKKDRSITQIALETKIKEKFLDALERGDYGLLPNFSVAQGFARSYAQTVDVNPKVVTALLRRDFPQKQHAPNRSEISLYTRSFWTPRTTLFAAVSLTFVVLGFYLIKQYMLFAGSPPVEIGNFIVGEEKVLVSGKTAPSATLEIDGQSVLVDSKGNFKAEIRKEDLGSSLEIKARSRGGKETVVRRAIDEEAK